MFTEGKVYIFRLLNLTPHLLPPYSGAQGNLFGLYNIYTKTSDLGTSVIVATIFSLGLMADD